MAVRIIKENKKARKSYFESSYKGLTISPFVPFSKSDYYGYDADKIGNDDPIIYHGDNMEIIICGSEEGSGCDIQVYVGEDIAYGNMSQLSFIQALRLGKKIAGYDDSGIDAIVDYLEDESGLDNMM